MVEWHLSPDYIINNWTDELLDLMITCMHTRKQKELASLPPVPGDIQKVSDAQLFDQLGNNIKVVKHGN